MKKLIYLVAAFFLVSTSVEAQFFKKLKKKVEQKVEERVTENVSNKAANEADKSLNRLWETELKNSPLSMGAENIPPSEIPASYDFQWEYTLNMKTSEGDMDLVYLLKEDAPYVGIKVPQAKNMITVLDNQNDMTVMYMTSDNGKMVMATKINPEASESETTYEDMEVKKIGTKTVQGYECQGYQTEDNEYILTFYITDEAGVGFNNLYNTSQKDIPKGLQAEWLNQENALMMEMHMENKKNPERNATMTCTGIEKKSFSVRTSDYQAIGG